MRGLIAHTKYQKPAARKQDFRIARNASEIVKGRKINHKDIPQEKGLKRREGQRKDKALWREGSVFYNVIARMLRKGKSPQGAWGQRKSPTHLTPVLTALEGAKMASWMVIQHLTFSLLDILPSTPVIHHPQ